MKYLSLFFFFYSNWSSPSVHPLFVWAERSRRPQPENKTEVRGDLWMARRTQRDNLQKKQWLSSSLTLCPVLSLTFAWWQMKGLCASLTLFWFLCVIQMERKGSLQKTQFVCTRWILIPHHYSLNIGLHSYLALVRLVLLNSLGSGSQEGECHCMDITGNTAEFQSIPPHKWAIPLNLWIDCWTRLNTVEQCHVWTWQTTVDRLPCANGPRNEKAQDHGSLCLLGKSLRPIYHTDGKSIVNHLEKTWIGVLR